MVSGLILLVLRWYILEKQKHGEGAKRTVLLMLQVSTCMNEIKDFERTQVAESLLLSELLTEQLHL